jgi:hypothetical protein
MSSSNAHVTPSRPLALRHTTGNGNRSSRRCRKWHELRGFEVRFEVLPGAPEWLREHARLIVPALPASGPELQQLLLQLGVAIR